MYPFDLIINTKLTEKCIFMQIHAEKFPRMQFSNYCNISCLQIILKVGQGVGHQA